MANKSLLFLLLLVASSQPCIASRINPSSLVPTPSTVINYHNGPLLKGNIPISILWYGIFTPSQKAILTDFISSLTPHTHQTRQPSLSQWWNTIEDLYLHHPTRFLIANQLSDEKLSIGRFLSKTQISNLAKQANPIHNGIVLVLTADDVAVEGFCMSSCGSHGSDMKTESAYIWVGNSASQCPGQCAWPFHQPMYGPQAVPLVAPNGDVGVDGMVITLASMVAGTVTNPFGNGFYQGDKEAPLEAATACPGVYGKGAYPGYAGEVLVDGVTGASFNAYGINSRKYLVPALYDPATASCSTLV